MRKQNLAIMAAGLLVASRALAGSLDPTNAPGPTMHTLEEIYQKVQSLDPSTLQTLSAATPLMNAGYYAATNLMQVDTDLTAANIKTNVTIFGVTGTAIIATGDATEAQVLAGNTFSKAGASGLTGTMTNIGAVSIMPGETQQTIPQGYHNGSGYVNGDSNLVTGNIKAGTTIFGVAGKTEVVDTTSGDVVAGDVLTGKKAWADGVEISGTITTRTLSSANDTVTAGYYAATNLTQVDADLTAENIKTNVTIFGIAGTLSANAGSNTYFGVLKTGQTNSYQVGDDGSFQKGVAGPNPRFTVQADTNCVLDNLTGLIWARNANLAGDTRLWSNAIVFCENLTYGGQSDWRLPNVKELQSLCEYRYAGPALCNTAGTGQHTNNNPFIGVRVQSTVYWSSTSFAADTTNYAVAVQMYDGSVYGNHKLYDNNYVWPVRGGQ